MSVYIAPSVWRSLNVRTALSMQQAFAACPPGETIEWEPLWGDALISRSRSALMTKFLMEKPQHDVMVTIDDDIVFSPTDLFKIIEGARRTRGIYGGTYLTHGTKPHLTCRPLIGSPELQFAQSYDPNPVEVEYISTGFMAVHRSVVEAMFAGEYEDADGKHRLHPCQRGGNADEIIIPFFDTMTIEEAPGVYHYLSEDWAFVERARQLGTKVYIDQSIILQHMGEHAASVLDWQGPGLGTDTVTISVPRANDELVATLADDLGTFTGQSPTTTWTAMREGMAVVAQMWETWPQSEEKFYLNPQVGVGYALDLAWWHSHGGGGLEHASGLAGKRVLDYGSGIGTFALIAARDGAQVEAWEVNPWLREFTQFRAQQHGLNVTLLTDEPTGQYDAIMCWHVLEHLSDPLQTLQKFRSMLSPNGVLIMQADFHSEDGHPMHHTMTEAEVAALLRSAGLVSVGEDRYQPLLVSVP